MKQEIIDILQKAVKPLSLGELTIKLKVLSHAQQEELLSDIQILKDNNIIEENNKNEFYVNKNIKNKMLIGTIQVTNKGTGFVKSFNSEKEYRVNIKNVNGALNNDEIVFSLLSNSDEAVVNGILKRNTTKLIGTIILDVFGQKTLSIHNNKLQKYQVVITNLADTLENNIVIAKINDFKDNVFNVTVEKTIGNLNDPGVDILSVIYEFGIKPQFNADTLVNASKINQEVLPEQKSDRIDLRNEILVTIDGKDAKDFDDAICVYKLSNGNYRLIVAIADVSFYVTPGSALDNEAFDRGTSVYLADRVVPMLPVQLSNGICSLNEQVERLCMVCDMEINELGNTVNHKIYQGLMKSVRRMNYDEVNEAFQGKKPSFINTHPQVWTMLQDAKQLFKILAKYKQVAGVVNFEINESKVVLNESGEVTDIVLRVQDEAEKLIESFMVRANEVVAKTIAKKNLPFVYRIHGQPKSQKIQKILLFLKIIGVKIPENQELRTSKDFQVLLDSIKNLPSFQIVSGLLLRSMEKAIYSNKNIGHFGLASEYYTHFTSPIRRYPDLVVHRLLRQYLVENNKIDSKLIEKNRNFTALASEQSSNMEVKAMECERAVEQMKKAEYMAKFVGNKFSAIISGVTSFGIFVQLPNTIEGLIKLSDLEDDNYQFNEKSMTIYGVRKRKQYTLGQKVYVVLKSANKTSRTIDFVFDLSNKSTNKLSNNNQKFRNKKNKKHQTREKNVSKKRKKI